MEDVLEVYQRPYDGNEVLVCMDETSKQLVKETRVPRPAAPGTVSVYATDAPAYTVHYYAGYRHFHDYSSQGRLSVPTRTLLPINHPSGRHPLSWLLHLK